MGEETVKFSEETLRRFSAPLSKAEDEMCQHSISMVREAVKKLGLTDDGTPIKKLYEDTYSYSLEMRTLLSNRRVKIFIQGSYANNTNVRAESDVDIAIVQEEVFYPIYREGISGASYGFVNAPVSIKTFKDEVQECLEAYFENDVERKNKSIKIHGNTYRKDADTIPCRRYRDYSNDYIIDENNYVGGILITADDGSKIINYPEQHIANGRLKNNSTNRAYKRMVRIVKTIRNMMDDVGYASAKKVTSFGLESLFWNIQNDNYVMYSLLGFTFQKVIDYAYDNRNSFGSYKEANGIKLLCPSSNEISNYQAFIVDLKRVFEYDYST